MLKAMASGELEDWPQRVRCFLVDQELSLNLEANPIEEVLAADTASLALQEEAAMLEEEEMTSAVSARSHLYTKAADTVGSPLRVFSGCARSTRSWMSSTERTLG